MSKSVRSFFFASFFLALVPFSQAFAIDPVSTGFFSNKAVSGYDTVELLLNDKLVKGKSKFSTSHEGAKWLFASQDNLDKFKTDPAKYAPQYGGYCAWIIAQGDDASGDPRYRNIIDGKLYLNYDEDIQKKWEKNIPQFIADADKKWPSLVSN